MFSTWLAHQIPNSSSLMPGTPVISSRAVVVGVRHLVRAGDQRLEVLLGVRDAGDGQRAVRGAVVGDVAGDHLVLHRLADELEVLLGQLPGGLHGLAAAGGEEDLVQVARGVVRPAGRPARSPAGARSSTAGRTPAPEPACRPPPRARRGRARPARRTGPPGRPDSSCRWLSKMRAPSPRTMVGTGLSRYPDIRVKCIQRWS